MKKRAIKGDSVCYSVRMTLKEFIVKCGSQEKAAQEIGVSFTTVNRWVNGHGAPRGLAKRRLQDLGIMVGK